MIRPSNNPVDTLPQIPDEDFLRLPDAQVLFPYAKSLIFAWESGSLVFLLHAATTDPVISWLRIRTLSWRPPFYRSHAFFKFKEKLFEDISGKGVRY